MNNKFIYLPISFLVLFSIGVISLEIPHFSLMLGFMKLLILTITSAAIFSYFIYQKFKSKVEGENKYTLVGLSLLCSFVVIFAFVSIINRKYATFDCEYASYKVLDYEGRYTSGYGNIKKGKLKANQWLLKLEIDGEVEQFVSQKGILEGMPVTRSMEFKFCEGILGTKYLAIE